MNRYILIRRLRGPAFLLLLGVIALLHETGLVHHMWHWFWPLALILWGVLLLAERAVLEVDGYPQPYPDAPYPGAGYPQGQNPGMATGPIPPAQGTSMVPANDLPTGSNLPAGSNLPTGSNLPAGSNDVERTNGGQS